jgi:membrane protease YdiL (CAAX protease family)
MSDTDAPSRSLLDALPLSRRGIIAFSLSAATVFAVLSWAIIVFYRRLPFLSVFDGGMSVGTQALIGVLAGSVLGGLIAILVMRERALAPVRVFIHAILVRVQPGVVDVLIVSCAAGFSEELFFRGTLQPMWGPWLAALAFALAHVGGNVFSLAKLGFAVYVFLMGMIFGLVYGRAGLVAAITTHATCNVAFLMVLMLGHDRQSTHRVA